MREQFRVDLRGLVEVLESPPLQQRARLPARTGAERAGRRRRPRRARPRHRGPHRDRAGLGHRSADRPRQRHRAHRRGHAHAAVDDRQHLQARRLRDGPPRLPRPVRHRPALRFPRRRLHRGPLPVRPHAGRADAALGRQQRRNLHDHRVRQRASRAGHGGAAAPPLPGLPMVRARQRRRVRERLRRAAGRRRPHRRHGRLAAAAAVEAHHRRAARLVPGTLRVRGHGHHPAGVDLGGRHGAGLRAALHGPPRLPDRRPHLLQGHAGRRHGTTSSSRAGRSSAAPSSTRASFR